MYRWRHLTKKFFCNLKRWRRIATRHDKTDRSFAMINLAAAIKQAGSTSLNAVNCFGLQGPKQLVYREGRIWRR